MESELMEVAENNGNSILSDCTNKSSVNEKRIRNFEIVDELIDKAKLNKEELAPLVQNIYLGKTIAAADEFKLLEIDEEKLEYLLEGNSLIIRGDESENAICCTKNGTFSFKVAEISNPLLITGNLVLPDKLPNSETRHLKNVEVGFMTNCYFTMNKEKPKLQKLRNLLEMNLYCGKAFDQNNDANKYTIKDFLGMIQSSEEEIYTYLNYIEAYQIDGYWRILDFKFYNEILDNILKMMDERCWPCDQIPVKEIYNELENLYGFFYLISHKENPNFYSIKKQKIFHFYAEAILRGTLKMRYAEFQLILRNSLPSNFNMEFDISLIQDICYVEEPYIYYLNTLDLPDDLEKRFKYLFEKRKKWTHEELKAFIQDLCSNNQTEISNALTKYCRAYTQNNVKYFTSRM